MCPVVEATSLPDDDSLAVENAQRTNIIIAVDKSVVFVYNPQPANLQHETICHIVIASNIFLLYVLYGNAKQYISDRMYQHKNDIKNIDKNYKKTGLVQHVSETRHKFYFEGVAIMHNEPNTYRRKMLEAMTKSENQGWTGRIFIHDVKEKLNINNLWKPYSKHRTKLLAEQFERVWKLEVESCSKIHKRPSLIRTVFRTYWLDFVILASIHLLSYVADVVIRPTLVKTILNYFTANDLVTPTEFYIAGVETIVFSIFSRFLTAHYTFGSITSGMILRTACTSLIYKKSLCISSQALREISSGQVINLISNDVSRFDNIVMTGNFLWSTPIVASFICYMIYVEAGVAGIPGFFVIILVCIAQGYGARVTSQCRRKIAVKTDERIRITDEVLNGIHVVKMHAWEIPFYNLILKARKLELKEIFKANCVRGIFMGFTILTRRTAICFTLITYVVLGKSLSASMVYVLIMYFGMVSGLLTGTFIRGIGEVAEGLVSFRRIEDFLLSGELSSIKEKEDLNKNVDNLPHDDPIVTLKDVTSSWMENSNEYALKAITMTARKGQTTMVVGSTGSGKSSLLQLICGEMKTVMGTVSVSGSISYSSQEPWVFGGTIKENILFGTPYDRDRYEEVISVCCLERDLDLFINGDMETVGEKGASLSGGQRARINLARAIYKDADIYLLDDPLSAVDAHVSKSIFQNCIQEFLKKKTVILATHQVQFMKYVDNIVLMKNGFIENEGTFLELLSAGHECIKSLQKNIPETKGDFDVKEKIEMKKWPSLQRIVSCDDSISIVSIVSDMEDMDIPRPVNKDSEYEYKGSPYIDYLKTGKSIILPFVFMFFFIGAQVFANISDYFINIWINKEEEEELNGSATDLTERDEMVFISVYVAIIVGLFISAFSRGFAFFALTQKCSKHLHTILLKSIIFTKMSFFNNNPTGAILNRFARDLGSTDEVLPRSIFDSSHVFGQAVGTVILLALVNYVLLIPLVFLALVSYFLRNFFMKTSLNLKRIESACRSPIFTHFSSTLSGLTTIRAYGSQDILIHQFYSHQDFHTSAMYAFQATLQSYTLLLDLMSFTYLGFVIFSFAIFGNDARGADVGLAITQTFSVAAMLQWGLRAASETTSLMTSVERILAFVGLEPEESTSDKKKIPPPLWPSKGRVDFNNVTMYYKDSAPVLKKLTFTINSGEKVGIVGRTGAGKSSLMQALFQFADIIGDIYIDGVNTKDIPVNILRSRIAVIPQNPILFSGDVRKNLDPYSDYPDYVLLKVLDELEIPDYLKENGLDTRIQDGGANISIGQKQLLCLARAILRNTNIIILDEATANVDPSTDELIQKIIKKKFSKCTVLTIAHRLNTIMDSDRIAVMDSGRLVEFDSPHLLLQRKRGYFSELVRETGRDMATDLIIQAEKNYWRKQESLQD